MSIGAIGMRGNCRELFHILECSRMHCSPTNRAKETPHELSSINVYLLTDLTEPISFRDVRYMIAFSMHV